MTSYLGLSFIVNSRFFFFIMGPVESRRGLANLLDRDVIISDFDLYSHYHVHFFDKYLFESLEPFYSTRCELHNSTTIHLEG